MINKVLKIAKSLALRISSSEFRVPPEQSEISPGNKQDPVPDLKTIFMSLAAQKRERLQVVQVGANDGVTYDPVFSFFNLFAKSALLVEPQPTLVPKLRENYSNFKGNLIIENMAVTSEEGVMKLYELTEDAGRKYHAVTGFNPTGIAASRWEHLASHLLKYEIVTEDELDSAIRWQKVPTRPLHQILKLHGIEEIDFLQVDTEGADWLVLKTLGEHRPPVINFEWIHLDEEDWSACRDWMEANQYSSFIGDKDCVLIRDYSW